MFESYGRFYQSFFYSKIYEIRCFGNKKFLKNIIRDHLECKDFVGNDRKDELMRILNDGLDKGNVELSLIFSYLLENGKIFPRDEGRARLILEKNVKAGDALSSIYLALKLFEGKSDLCQEFSIESLFDNVIKSNNSDDIYTLIMLFVNCRFGDKFPDMLQRLCELGENLNAPEIMKVFAEEIMKGSFGEVNLERAYYLLQKGVELNHPASMFELARSLQTGKFGEGRYDEAQRYYKQAFKSYLLAAEGYLTNPMIEHVCAELSKFELSHDAHKDLKIALINLEEEFFELRANHQVNEECNLSHFTSWGAIESILNLSSSKEGLGEKRNILRQYHVDYMNDPTEGKRLLSFAPVKKDDKSEIAKKISKTLNEIFERNYFGKFSEQCVTEKLLPSIFMLSLTRESDRLDLWRAYGNDGKGYCLKLPFEENEHWSNLEVQRVRKTLAIFQNSTNEFSKIENMYADGPNMSMLHFIKTARKKITPTAYDIKYSDIDVEATLLKLGIHLEKIFSLKFLFKKEKWHIVEECICSILLELLYLYKDEQYSTEREARVLSVLNLKDERIKADERTPGHLYCETEPFLFTTPGSEVILGPKVEKKAAHLWNIRYRLTKLGFDGNTTVKESKVLYR